MAEIRVLAGPLKGSVFKIGLGISTIGREQTNSIRINDFEISRRHAELHVRANEHVLYDLASSNGTLVNTKPISTKRLETGDQIQIGRTVLEFHLHVFHEDSVSGNGDTVCSGNDDSRGEEETLAMQVASVDQLSKTKSNLEVLYHTALAAGTYQSSESLLQRILDLVFCWISAQRVCILVREDEQENLLAKSLDPKSGGGYSSDPFDVEYDVIKYVFRKNEGVLVTDVQNDERFPGVDIDNLNCTENRQIICAPINGRYGIRGVIYADNSTNPLSDDDSVGPEFDEDQLKLLIAIGLHAAVAIENADHYAMTMHSEREAAVGNAMATLSHHIKNILQSINGGNHLIEDGLANQQFGLIESGWQIVQRNQESLSNLVMDMLCYGKSVAPTQSESELQTVVSDAIQLVARHADYSRVQIKFDEPEPLPTMWFEPELLKRAIHNVLLASVNACRENSGGTVEIFISHDDEKRMTTIRIVDDGVNLTHLELQSIFDPLVIGKKSSRIGLGMAVANKIVGELGGRIAAENNENQGTSFTIVFENGALEPAFKTNDETGAQNR